MKKTAEIQERNNFTNLFNVFDEKEEWLCQEDRDFSNLQMSTNGRACHCTTIEDTQGVHPRKLELIKQKVSQYIDELSSEEEENNCTEEEKQNSGFEDSDAPTTSKRQKTGSQ